MLRFGLFGAGRIGRVHADSLAAHPRAELVTVYDPVEPAAREVAGQYGAERVTVLNLDVVKIDGEKNLVLVRGAVPGPNGGIVSIRPTNRR